MRKKKNILKEALDLGFLVSLNNEQYLSLAGYRKIITDLMEKEPGKYILLRDQYTDRLTIKKVGNT